MRPCIPEGRNVYNHLKFYKSGIFSDNVTNYLIKFMKLYDSANNTTIAVTPLHNTFRPQTAIIRCLSYAKTVALYRMSTFSLFGVAEGREGAIETVALLPELCCI
jgi:subtilase family serine protease